MEGYKDVMLSEPPTRFTAAPSVQPVNLETYKGILLCDRPPAAANRNNAPIPFLPGGKGEDKFIGIQPSNEQRARLLLQKKNGSGPGQPNNNAIVAKHKRWLKNFANTMKKARLDNAESQIVADARAAAFREKQAKMRSHYPNANEEQPPTPPPQEPKVKGKGASKSKPKWAMTAEEAEDKDDEEFMSQHNDLLNFAKNLNYEKFIDDFEMQEALSIMKERVDEIVLENGVDPNEIYVHDNDDLASECPSQASTTTRAAYRLAANRKAVSGGIATQEAVHDASWDSTTKGDGRLAKTISTEAYALADSILKNSESMRKIHTRQTLAKLLQDAVKERGSALRGPAALDAQLQLGGDAEQTRPRVVNVSAESTGREAVATERRVLTDLRKATDRTQNLPYLYRCPAL